MVVAPVEPIIFQCGKGLEAFTLCRAGDGAALKIPLTAGGGVDQEPWGVAALAEEFQIVAVNAGDEHAEFAGGAAFGGADRRDDFVVAKLI